MTAPIDWSKYSEVYHRYRTGVYGIVNLSRDRVYVGATTGDFCERWNFHRRELKHGIHRIPLLQKDWWIDGHHVFTFLVFQELRADHPSIDLYERFWLDSFREAGIHCYNSFGVSSTYRSHQSSRPWLRRTAKPLFAT